MSLVQMFPLKFCRSRFDLVVVFFFFLSSEYNYSFKGFLLPPILRIAWILFPFSGDMEYWCKFIWFNFANNSCRFFKENREIEVGVGGVHGFILNAQIPLGLKVAVMISSCEFRALVLILKSKDIFLMFF